MVVNSFSFLLFFVVVFIVYYLPFSKQKPRFQNVWLLLTSYFFYGYANWKMLPLLFGSTVVFYLLGLWLGRTMQKGEAKKASHITTLGVVLGVGILLYFKYLNFFAESFAQLFQAMGLGVSWTTLNIVLPVGVSFFTFKLIGYIIEVHRGHIEPVRDFVRFGAFFAFFPTILSGPIDRPNCLIPQLGQRRTFDYTLAVDGCRQILWGMFTKMCIADNLATITDGIWADYSSQSGSTLLVVALLYLVQMYADFDGYSNMAIGVGKLLGFKITRNFNHPLLARNVAEYWRRWHMSLTSWITDYIFMPLNIAFRDLGNLGVILACTINLVVIGLWHGANWTYAVFGLYHALLFVPLILSGSFGKIKKLKPGSHGLPLLKDFGGMLLTFCLVSFGLIIFRAPSVMDAFLFIEGIVSNSFLTMPSIAISKITLFFILILFVFEWFSRNHEFALAYIMEGMKSYATMFICVLLFVITILFKGNQSDFIYFQF